MALAWPPICVAVCAAKCSTMIASFLPMVWECKSTKDLEQLAKSRGRYRHGMCEADGHACLFDRSERTLGASGGERSAHARSRSPLLGGSGHRETGGGATARDRFTRASADSGPPPRDQS